MSFLWKFFDEVLFHLLEIVHAVGAFAEKYGHIHNL